MVEIVTQFSVFSLVLDIKIISVKKFRLDITSTSSLAY